MFNDKTQHVGDTASPQTMTSVSSSDPERRNEGGGNTGLSGRRDFLKTGAAVALAPLILGAAPPELSPSGRKQEGSTAATTRKSKEGQMDIQRNGDKPSVEGPSDWFTGSVRIDPLFDAKDPSRVTAAVVVFEPGARTAWHTHPVGQHIVITSGLGWVQQEGGPIQEVRPGDVVWFPPGVKHWHGASPKNAMAHIAIQESHNGSAVEWLEHVSDKQYRK